MVANGGNTEGLFHAAFMESGSPIPVGDITHGQKFYDAFVVAAGCEGSSDTLQCLREAPFAMLQQAMDASPSIFSPSSLDLAWMPRVDGTFLPDDPQQLVLQGSVANIPFVSGDCDDEGTLFSLTTLDVTTEEQLRDYITSTYLPAASSSDLDKLLTLYPADITQGSPYDTGILNALSPQFKRLASLQGDLVFQGARRFFLQQQSDKQNTWSFHYLQVHASDLLNIYGSGELTDYLVNFVNNLNPNGPTVPYWPKYTTASVQLLTFLDGLVPVAITTDTYRQEAMEFIIQLALANPL
ncbi:hypothetical protein PHLCEN_2v6976 [Hermanssonia centrifuga]|uniref:Carboxylesterase type B domain-containing protein n=1 Tax=Hermanssonia centrifuga TaxID=98765 RepID=A0A2R6NXX6_9APHY|nr:hypothetical protein PHLCEN_2v6976 [Hermanssonia centrifuga]